MSDFNILIGVDMTNAENDIKKSIANIGEAYKLKLDMIIGNKDVVFKQIRTIQDLFSKLGKLDVDFGLKDGAKDVLNIKDKLEDISNVDLSDAGKELSKSLDDARKKLKAVKDEYGKMMKVMEKEQNNVLMSTEISGDKFLSKRQTKKQGINGNVIEEKTPEPPTYTRNFDALEAYVNKAMVKINSMKNVAKSSLDDVTSLVERLTMLNAKLSSGDGAGFHDEVKAINELIEKYDQQERKMIELNKVREEQAKQAIKWAEKLADVERNGYAKSKTKQAFDKRIGDLTNGNFESIDELNAKLKEVSDWYAKIRRQEKDGALSNKVQKQYDKLNKTVNSGKLQDEYVDPKERTKLKRGLNDVKNADNELALENALKRVNAQYDKMLADQAQAIRNQKQQVQQAEELASLQKHLSDTETERARLSHEQQERAYEVRQRTGLVDSKYKEVGQQKSKMVDSGFIDAKEFDQIENKLRELGRLAQNEYVDKLDVQKELNAIDKEMNKIVSRYEELDAKQRKIRVSTHDWGKEIDRIKSQGFVNDNEFDSVRKSIQALSADSKTYEQDLKRVETQINRLNQMSVKRAERQETRDITKGRNDEKIESMRGTVPDDILDDAKGMNNMLDFSSSKKDIAFIEDEMRKLTKLKDDLIKAGKDEEKRLKAIADHQLSAIKSADKYGDIIDDIVKTSKKQIDNDDRINRIKTDSARIQEDINELTRRGSSLSQEESEILESKRRALSRLEQEQKESLDRQNKLQEQSANLQDHINALKLRGTQLSYDEQRAIQQQIQELRRLAREQREVDSGGNSRDRQEQSLRDKFNSVSYRATRGFGENSTEARKLKETIRDIEQMVNGLSGKVGSEFNQATREIEEAMNRLNSESRRLRDEDARRRNSTSGQLVNALRKVPIWAAAMAVVYGTVEQIKQGFQSVLDIDAAMINLAKVSEASKQQLDEFRSTASEMGREMGVVAKDVIDATTAFQKLGYTLEQSTMLGKNSILYANVGDMDVNTASDNLTGTIQGFGIEVDAAGTNVRKVVDMFNEVSNNFAITAEGIGQVMTRSAAVMHQAGNTMEEAIALSASANAIIQNPTKVGNALKTVAMRLRGISEEGEVVEELGSKLQVTFERINKEYNLMGEEALNILEDDGKTFKSTYEIFAEVESVWARLSDLERSNLTEIMGGKQQGNVVAAIIQNWDDAERAAKTAANSSGSAMQEFSAYMDGFEYKIGQLKNALEQFWTTVIDDDAVKMLIDMLTSLVDTLTKVVETVGTMPLLSVVGGLLALLGSKGLRESVLTVTSLGGAFKGLGTWVMTAVKGFGRLVPFLAVLLAIGEAANIVYKIITAESRARKERLKVLDAEISKMKEFKDNYEDTFKESFDINDFANLQSKGTARSTEEEQKYLETINKIKDTMPELISHYDEKGNAIIKTTGEIRELIRVNEDLLLQNQKEQLKINIDEASYKDVENKIRRIDDAQNQLMASEASEKMGGVAKEYLENAVKEIDESNYIDVLNEFNDKVTEAYNSLSEEEQNYSMMQFRAIQSVVPQAKNKEDALNILDGIMRDNEAMRKFWEDDVKKTRDSIKVGSDEVIKQIDESFRIVTQERKIDSNSNTFLFIDQLKQNMIDNLETFGPSVRETIESIPDYIDQVLADIESRGISFDDLLVTPETEGDLERVKTQLQEIRDELYKANPNNPMIQMYDALILKHMQAFNAIKNAPIAPPINIAQDVLNPMQEFMGGISDLDSAYRTLQEGQSLSLSTVMDLISKHPSLIKHMKMENGVLKITQQSLKDLARQRENDFRRELQIRKESAQQAMNEAKEKIKAIKLEMQANQEKLNSLKKAAGYQPSENPMFVDQKTESQQQIDNMFPWMSRFADEQIEKAEQGVKEQKDQIDKLTADAKANKEGIDAIDAILAQDFTAQLGSINNNKEKKEKEEKELQDAIYVVDKYAKTIDGLNRMIEKQQKLQGEYSSQTKAHKDAINQEIFLTNAKKKAIDQEIASLQKQIKAKNIQKTGLIQINKNENENKTARAIAAELAQEIDQAEDRLRQLNSESDSTATRINELRMTQVQSMLDTYAVQRDALSDDIAYQEYAMNLYDKTTQAYRDHANEKLKLVKQQQKTNKEELAYLLKQKEANKNLTNAQINELNAQIRAKREAIYEMDETIRDIQTLIAESGLEKYMYQFANESEKYADAISDIQDKIKYDLDKEGDYGQHIDYLKQIIELRKGERADILKNIKYLENQLALYGDNQEMVDKISDELGTWKDKLKDTENAIKDTNLEIKDVYESISDEYVEMYKEQLQLMQQADEKFYQDKMKAEQKAHDNRMKQIDDELEALQDAFDKQMKMIDRAEARRDYEQDTSKTQNEIDELKKQIDLLSMDDSYEAKSKKAELVKQLTDKELELSEKQHDRQVDLRKENLEDDLEAEQDKLNARKERYQEDLDNLVESLEEEAKKKQEYWQAELNNEKKFAEMRKQVLDGNFEDMFETIDTWKENVSGKMAELGEQVTENFTYKVQEAIDKMKDLSTMKIGSYTNSTSKNGTNNLDGDLKPSATIPKDNELTEKDKAKDQATKDKSVIQQMKANSIEWHKADDKRKQELLDENQKLGKSIGAVYKNGTWYQKDGKTKLYTFDTGGYTGDWSDDEGRLAVLHKKELVLNEDQTKHILDTARIMEKVKSIIPTASLLSGVPKGIAQPTSTSTSESNEYNIEVNINGNADKKVADTVADQIVNKIKRTKGGRF